MAIPETVTYNVIGLMSGTSLDGLDIAFCQFHFFDDQWHFELVQAETVGYSDEWKTKLTEAAQLDALKFQLLHVEFGRYCGMRVADFIIKHHLNVDFIASHGHTVFHQPENKLTVQIGAGSAIAAKCNLPVVCDFRSLDVALGGQGAPLVPIGDQLLFPEMDQCLNLGGFANISFQHKGQRIAFDICPLNIVLNPVAELLGKSYDDKGEFARKGMLSHYFFVELNQLSYYKQIVSGPRSLGYEWVVQNVQPLLQRYELEPEDLLHTLTEHAATQISRVLKEKGGKVLVTGGGAYNSYLIERIAGMSNVDLILPDKSIIEFKEALIFAFLGVLRMRKETNSLRSVTGALHDNCGGAVYWA